MPESGPSTAPLRVVLVDDEPLVRRGLAGFLADERDVAVVAECRDGREAVETIRRLAPDLLFLDVQMPELDGLGVLAELGDARPPAVVFVTAYDAYALRAFELHAVDYLLKPFDEARFRTALDRARQRLAGLRAGGRREADAGLRAELDRRLDALLADLRPREAQHEAARDAPLERLVVRTGGRVVLVNASEIDWIEAADNYVRLHVGGARHVLRETVKRLEAQLDPRRFVRIHRSAIVNLDRVRELRALPSGDYSVLLQTGAQLTLSRGFRESFEQRLGRGL